MKIIESLPPCGKVNMLTQQIIKDFQEKSPNEQLRDLFNWIKADEINFSQFEELMAHRSKQFWIAAYSDGFTDGQKSN